MLMSDETLSARWGLAAFLFGVAAILASVALTSGMMAPEPEQSIGTTIGEIARDIRNAATGARGVDKEPARDAFDLQSLLLIVTPVLAAIAAVLGGVSLFRHEPAVLSKLAIAFGISAIAMQFVFWLALMICGTILLVSIVSNIGDILGT